MSTRTTTEPPRSRRPRTRGSLTGLCARPARPALAGIATLAALTALGVSGCTVTPGQESSEGPTTAPASSAQGASPSGSAGGSESTGSASPSGAGSPTATDTPLSLDQLGEALLDEESFPVADSVTREDTRVESAPFTMYVNLNGFTPEGECATALEKVNSFEAPKSSAVASTYTTDLQPSGESEAATVQFMAVTTQSAMDAMSVYSEIPEACGTLQGDEGTGATATFSPVELGSGAEDVHAMELRIEAPDGQEQTIVIGGRSEGRNHLYAVLSVADLEDAQSILTAQGERFDQALEQLDS